MRSLLETETSRLHGGVGWPVLSILDTATLCRSRYLSQESLSKVLNTEESQKILEALE